MNLSKFAVKYPVAITVVVIIVLLLAVVSFTQIPLDLFPDMEIPVLLVQADYEGAGPKEMENLVSRPMEESLSTVDNLSQITSISGHGQSQIIMEFDWDTDMDIAALDTREVIDMVSGQLPDDAEDPTVLQIDPDLMPILHVGIEAPEMTQHEISEFADGVVQSQLERVEGVGMVDIIGGVEREINVNVNPYRLNNYEDIDYDSISGAVMAENMDVSGGQVLDGQREYAMRTMGEFDSVDQLRRVQIGADEEGNPIRLYDVAQVKDELDEIHPLSRVNQEPTVALGIRTQSDANTVNVAQEVRQELNNLEETTPEDISFQVITDQSEFIQQAIQDITEMGIIGAVLAMFILWLFLGSIRTTLIIGIAIPISIIGTFNLMYFQGYTLNLLTMGGLTLGIGLVVDSSIILLENIFRKREGGLGTIDGAVEGSKEISGAIIAATLTSIAAFLPAVYTEGMANILFEPLAWTVVFALLASLLVALAVVPMLSVKFMGEGMDFKRKNVLTRKMEIYLNRLTDKYGQVIEWGLRRRFVVLGIFVVVMAGVLILIPFMGFEFFPEEDSGEIRVDMEYPVGTPVEITDANIRELEEEIAEIDEVDIMYSRIGGADDPFAGGDDHQGNIDIVLVDDRERDRDTFEIADEIRGMLPEAGGIDSSVSVADAQEEGGGGPGMDQDVTVVVKGDDLDILERLSDDISQVVLGVPGVVDSSTNFEDTSPEVQIELYENVADSYGLTSRDVGSFVRRIGAGERISFLREGGDEYDINMEISHPRGNMDISTVESMLITSPMGSEIPLEEVVSFNMSELPREIEREDRARTGIVGVQIEGRDMGSVVDDIQQEIAAMEFPTGYTVDYGGTYEMMMDSFEGLGLALILAVILVYLVMAAKFGSFLYPFIVMFTLPQAVIGVVLALLLTGYSLSIVALMGVIMLAGIVVNNGIVMVDYINKLYHDESGERFGSIVRAGKIRLRPILMTVLTTVFGMLPLAIGGGEGAESRAPMAISIIGGLLVSTLITLILIPVVYSLLDDLKLKFYERFFTGVEDVEKESVGGSEDG